MIKFRKFLDADYKIWYVIVTDKWIYKRSKTELFIALDNVIIYFLGIKKDRE